MCRHDPLKKNLVFNKTGRKFVRCEEKDTRAPQNSSVWFAVYHWDEGVEKRMEIRRE